ncbi:MAG: IMP dehydrogenase [Bdellovibrionales bacterium RIFOXYD12_FULL_39_22]|nr:MAG: IMP dehydrogenase [Bdellovibrionales bacterium RIFOXYB1_FULL_39_21]OFZ41173.1 MAG: IMP dehydrogenase [Bdellovibrionales bacterium RIFOXYC12_FULL_39_17]OFZ44927.1 MAG: IMP dehydrogenase [Bdellovibrionales bacterium RIFOXYC1_FULL_39_130]OFZ74374.1 MAG: IMP dehydrogenase [Bdellovibrionales bacterium RIFOXYD1_FULL_39_84]OFZ92376.1 MAG: IMP dehydrogenase [Bdellovibrionales bacterium RIFOXYD12_FULL_39_22]HLE10703.1 IMP dehydrogenase [Bacteriovoracaceae bacterium]
MATLSSDVGLTYDDVLLLPAYSEFLPSDVLLRTKFTRNIEINIPLSSAAMDTVTEAATAIVMAREGGIGVLHKNLAPNLQAAEVEKVKKAVSGIILHPIVTGPDATLLEVMALASAHHVTGLPVVDEKKKLVGILTNRDMRYESDLTIKVKEVMTPSERLITASPNISMSEAKQLLKKHRIEKLPVIDREGHLKGLITISDIQKNIDYPLANKDSQGRLRVAAAIGVGPHELARAKLLAEMDVDVLVIDTAHGHSRGVIEMAGQVKKMFSQIQLVAGNVATADACQALIAAGVDGVKVGIGPGSICTTRVVAGIGVPQFSAVLECSKVCKAAGVALIADGGIKYSGDIVKALAAGADSVMIGSLFAGTDESPGEMVLYKGRAYKVYRGMGSLGAMVHGSKDRYGQGKITDMNKLVPEGIEGQVPHRGPLSQNIYQLIGGIKSGMGYVGASDLRDLQAKARFITISAASLRENHPHDVQITKEAPNYSLS